MKEKRVIRFAYWPDGSLTVIRRDYHKEYKDGKYADEVTLSESTDLTNFTSTEVDELRKAVRS